MASPTEPDRYDPLDVAVRAWARRTEPVDDGPGKPKRPRSRKGDASQRTIIFDAETTTDAAQRLNFGVWRYYQDRVDELPGTICFAEGIFYADDLPERDPEGFALLTNYVKKQPAATSPGRDKKINLLSRSEFVEQIIYEHGYKRRATIAGFNLPFDLSRIAIDATTSRRSRVKETGKWKGFYGGNSLVIYESPLQRHRPRISYKAIDSKRALISFTSPDRGARSPKGAPRRKTVTHTSGNFLDLRTLAFALKGKPATLEGACEQFHVSYVKRDVTHGSISEEYVTYCREDVGATTKLLRATTEEFRRHPITLRPTNALSPASIGKAYLKAMGIRPARERQPDFDSSMLAAAMAAYYGGRAECRIRKVPLPVIYTDFLSMYPTVHTLMGTWGLVTAQRVEVDEATESVRELLAAPNLPERCFNREFWTSLVGLVQIVPDGHILPVRALYDPAGTSYNIGVNPFRDTDPRWYSLPDVVASVILTGRVPSVISAKRFVATGQQEKMRKVRLRSAVEVDPRTEDFFARVVEVRKSSSSDEKKSDHDDLDGFLKVLANATGYGIYAEMTRREEPEKVEVEVSRGDGSTFHVSTDTPEDPENYCFPPLAAVITGGAKLMLALLEHEVKKRGGSYVFCDTDSMAIVADDEGSLLPCPGGGEVLHDEEVVRALSTKTVDEIVKRFEELNPYDRNLIPGSILKIEKENFVGERRIQLSCFAISAKRYVLYEKKGEGEEPRLVKISEHGLGHLLNPLDPDDESEGWMWEVWETLLRRNLGERELEPEWLDRPALTKITASGPAVLGWFNLYNAGRPFTEQVKPGNFFLIATADPMDASELRPFAPYERDASKWLTMPWFDRRTGEEIRVTTQPPDGNLHPGVLRVRTYRDVLGEYEAHPEMKSLGPDGKAVGRNTVGLLRSRPVERLILHCVGKEGNLLDERMEGVPLEVEEYSNEYVDPAESTWARLVVPVLATMNQSQLVRDSGIDRKAISSYIHGGRLPRREREATLTLLAVECARNALRVRSPALSGSAYSVLAAYLGAIDVPDNL